MLQELPLHHATADGILYRLSPVGVEGGFGRLTREGLGNDALADRMMKHFATQSTLRVTIRSNRRDPLGYVPLSVSLQHVACGVVSLGGALCTALDVLYRKYMVCGLGTAVTCQVRKVTSRGTVLTLSNGLPAVALEQAEEGATTVVGRVLDYDVGKGIVAVSTGPCVGRVPPDAEAFTAVAESLHAGDTVECTVLLPSPSSGPYAAVVEVEGGQVSAAKESPAYTLVGYLMAGQRSEKYDVGAKLRAVVRFVPSQSVQGLTPFLVLDVEEAAASIGPLQPPALRCTVPQVAVRASFAWREATECHCHDNDAEQEDEPRMRRRRLEEAIDAYERTEEKVPSSPEEFRKALLASPNSSFLWVHWMAFHVNLQQLEDARQVAEKALKTIGVRESKELLNVWVAYMNLENMHGTGESLTSIFKRALQHNDNPLVVYEKLADVFAASKKYQQLIELCRAMASRFRTQPKVWERLGCALILSNKRDQLKRLMKDISAALSKTEQCLVAEHIAIYEYKSGSVEAGRAMFEGLLLKAPKRSDLWSAYLDQEMALLSRSAPEASLPTTRSIFERSTSISLPPSAMQQLLTKYLLFEQKHGNADDVQRVKEKARQYVAARVSSAAPSGSGASANIAHPPE